MTEKHPGSWRPRPWPGPWAGAWLTVVVLVICTGAFVISTGFVPATTRFFPQIIAGACVVVALADLGMRALANRRATGAANGTGAPERINPAAEAPTASILRYAAWFFGYLVAIWLVSLIVASGLFVAAFLWREAKLRWWSAIIAGVIVIAAVIFAGNVFHIRWPASLIDPLKQVRFL